MNNRANTQPARTHRNFSRHPLRQTSCKLENQQTVDQLNCSVGQVANLPAPTSPNATAKLENTQSVDQLHSSLNRTHGTTKLPPTRRPRNTPPTHYITLRRQNSLQLLYSQPLPPRTSDIKKQHTRRALRVVCSTRAQNTERNPLNWKIQRRLNNRRHGSPPYACHVNASQCIEIFSHTMLTSTTRPCYFDGRDSQPHLSSPAETAITPSMLANPPERQQGRARRAS